MFKHSVVPDTFKKSKVSLLPKKGDLTDTNNYRSLMLQSCIGKVISAALDERIKSLDLTSDAQNGFKKHHGTYEAHLTFWEVFKHFVVFLIFYCSNL